MNYISASIKIIASPARRSFVRNLLAGCLLFLLGVPNSSWAGPGKLSVSGKAMPPYTFTVVATTDYRMAGDGSNPANDDIVHVIVTDDNSLPTPGLPAAGVTVNFKLQGATGSNSRTTDGSGVVDYPVNNMTAGPMTVTVTVNGVPQTIIINFIAGPPSANPPGNPANGTYFIVTTDNSPADGTPDYVKVHITDQFGNNEPAGTQVILTLTGGAAFGTAQFPNGSTLTYTATTLDNSGDIQIPITSFAIGDLIVHATYGGADLANSSPQTVHFVVPPPNPNPPSNPGNPSGPASPGNPNGSTNFYITQDNQIANTTAQDKVLAHITNGISASPGVQVRITITGNGTATGPAEFTGNVKTVYVTTDANGDAEVPLTDSKDGTVEISAEILYNGVWTQINGSTQTVTFVAGSPSPNPPNSPNGPAGPTNPNGSTNFWITQDNQIADSVGQDKVFAHITDGNGNTINTPVLVTITITGNGSAAGQAMLPGAMKTISVLTSSSGDLEVPIVDTKAGKVEISASFVDPVTGVLTQIHGSTQTVTFVAGPPVPSDPSNPPAGGGPGGGAVGGPTGGSGPIPSDPSNPTGAGNGFTYLSMTHNDVPADGVSADTATAYITDARGNPLDGIPVTFTFHVGGPANSGALFQPGNVITITVNTKGGYAAVPITDTIAGDVWVDATYDPSLLIAGSSTTARFTEAPDVNNPETQLIVVVYEAIADGLGNTVVKAHVVDRGGNIMVGQDVKFAIDSGSAQMVTPATMATDANGDAYITLVSNKTGFVLITATVGGKPIIYGSPARVKFVPINIYVPRAFTPNNDGTNDVLKPILVGIATFHYFNVYNRWGNLIFTTQDPTRGWDGTFKGVAQPVETYLWIAEGIDIDGKKIVQKGMTSLVR